MSAPYSAAWLLLYDDNSERLRVSYDLGSRSGDSISIRMYGADDSELHIDLEDVRWLADRLLNAASAIEAATAAETPQDGSVHESATAESRDAQ